MVDIRPEQGGFSNSAGALESSVELTPPLPSIPHCSHIAAKEPGPWPQTPSRRARQRESRLTIGSDDDIGRKLMASNL
jgi:hypothetical protein